MAERNDGSESSSADILEAGLALNSLYMIAAGLKKPSRESLERAVMALANLSLDDFQRLIKLQDQIINNNG